MRILIASIILLLPFDLLAQTDDLVESISSTAEQSSSTETLELGDISYEVLENPIDLNQASADELLQSGLFTLQQVGAIIEHRNNFGNLLSLHELQVVDGFGVSDILRIRPYVTIGNGVYMPVGGVSRLLREGRQQLISRIQFVPETKAGFDNRYDSPPYEGSPAAVYIRYRFDAANRIRWGFTADKDPGEPLFKGSRKDGFDFYSMHLYLRDFGRFKTISLGDYRLSYGQGLVFSGGGRGIPSDPCLMLTTGMGRRPYTSAGESGFFRGAATSMSISKKITTDIFFSQVKRDANVMVDSDSINIFTSLQSSGLHRTWYEIADRKQVRERMFGAVLRYTSSRIRCDLISTITQYDRDFSKTFQYYNQFDFHGRSNPMIGLSAHLPFRNMNLFAEAAMDGSWNKGIVAGLVTMLGTKAGMVMMVRDYDIGFYNPHGGAFGASYRNSAERGLLFGITCKPSKPWMMSFSADRFQFKWLRYGVSAPTTGSRFEINLYYKPDRKNEISIRLRNSIRMEDGSSEFKTVLYPERKNESGVRLQLLSTVSKSITLRTRIEKKLIEFQIQNQNGFLFYQDVLFKPMASSISWNFRYANFDTDGYDSRIYAYENDVLYGYSIPSLYYRGTRLYANLQYKTRGNLTVWLRYAVTWYANREYVGSGYEAIEGNRKSEVKIQFRLEW
ncbi:MAG: ComEA family DNA-binding protein [Bacteroidota bacterium]